MANLQSFSFVTTVINLLIFIFLFVETLFFAFEAKWNAKLIFVVVSIHHNYDEFCF